MYMKSMVVAGVMAAAAVYSVEARADWKACKADLTRIVKTAKTDAMGEAKADFEKVKDLSKDLVGKCQTYAKAAAPCLLKRGAALKSCREKARQGDGVAHCYEAKGAVRSHLNKLAKTWAGKAKGFFTSLKTPACKSAFTSLKDKFKKGLLEKVKGIKLDKIVPPAWRGCKDSLVSVIKDVKEHELGEAKADFLKIKDAAGILAKDCEDFGKCTLKCIGKSASKNCREKCRSEAHAGKCYNAKGTIRLHANTLAKKYKGKAKEIFTKVKTPECRNAFKSFADKVKKGTIDKVKGFLKSKFGF